MENSGRHEVEDSIGKFHCGKNSDVERFLKVNAILFETTSKSRTYLIVDHFALADKGEIKILAYFSLALMTLFIDQGVSASRRKKLDGLFKNVNSATGYLIGQLGKNDSLPSSITGAEIINYAFQIILQSFKYVGGRFVTLECEDNEKLIKLYEDNGFAVLQKNDEDELVQLVRLLA